MDRTDTRLLFRPLCASVVSLLRALSRDQWERPTAGAWRVRDTAAHLLDTCLRRLSFHRDGLPPLAPPPSAGGEPDLLAFINGLNASWVNAAKRLSPRVLTDLYERASGDLCTFVEQLADDAPALFPVSWAGDVESPGWLDIGREFTEIWHHGAQIRHAVGAGPYEQPRWLRAVLEISLRALPHAYRDVRAPEGTSLAIRISGPSGGSWVLRRSAVRWDLDEGSASGPTSILSMTDEAAWRLLYNALSAGEPAELVSVEGVREFAVPLLQARSVIV